MTEHDQIIGIVVAKNQTPTVLDPRSTVLIVVDMQRYFTQPSFPFTEVFEKLSPGLPEARARDCHPQHSEVARCVSGNRIAGCIYRRRK